MRRGLNAGEHRERERLPPAATEAAAAGGRDYFIRMSFLTDDTPLTLRATSTALYMAA